MARGPYAFALGVVLVTAGFAKSGTFSEFSTAAAGGPVADNAATREQEWIVSEIAESMLDIAAYAGHFDAGDPFQVRNAGREASGAQRFRLTRGAEEYTVTTDRPWTPEAYIRMAKGLMADGAGLSITEDAIGDRIENASVSSVSRLLQNHPRSGAVHERAALLIGLSVQKRAAASPIFDVRPGMCRMTAHLAIARALHPGSGMKDGRSARQILAALAARQPDGMPPPVTVDHPQFWVIEQ